MFKHESKTEGIKVSSIITIVLFILAIITYIASKLGVLNINNIQKPEEVKFDSLSSTVEYLGYEATMPEFIVNKAESNEVEGIVTNKTFAKILIGDYIVSLTPFQSYEYDPLDVAGTVNEYNESKDKIVSKAYTIKNDNESEIKYISYRLNVPSLEDCTVINWSDDIANYGVLIGDKLSESEIFGYFGIAKENTEVYSADIETANEQTTEENLDTITIDTEHIRLQGKEFLEVTELDTLNMYSIGDSCVLAVIYGDGAKDSEDFTGTDDIGEVIISDRLVARYTTKNPFEQGDMNYEYYEEFIRTIDETIESIVYID
jgi:hypothetical protein